MTARRSRLLLLTFVAGAVLLLVSGVFAMRHLGSWLVAADPLVRSDVIFVTDGKTPHRELEAAILYREGWAPRVAVTLPRSDLSEEVRRLSGFPTEQQNASLVLRRAGVPDAAILRLERVVENTAQELAADFDYARAHGLRRVIIVSSPYHLRRVRIIWRSRFEHEIPAVIRGTRYEPVDPSRWWTARRSLEGATHELFGIAHFVIGSPIPTFGR
jgi:uncharacterized SAM-binding protein YcdF (DUF218 family)